MVSGGGRDLCGWLAPSSTPPDLTVTRVTRHLTLVRLIAARMGFAECSEAEEQAIREKVRGARVQLASPGLPCLASLPTAPPSRLLRSIFRSSFRLLAPARCSGGHFPTWLTIRSPLSSPWPPSSW